MPRKPARPLLRRLLYFAVACFALMNLVAAFHAWRFTHYSLDGSGRTRDEASLSFREKAVALVTGVSLPRPENGSLPVPPFETIHLQSNKRIECWLIRMDNAVGTVVLFPGYGGSKGALLGKAEVFRTLGYETMLVDFMGAGGSEGRQTTIGYKEAEQVKTCVEYLAKTGERNITLFGSSMGAVAIMKALNDGPLPVRSIILECPFGSMLQTVTNRFDMMNLPAFPFAHLLVFWGGLENGFNAFAHKPTQYARRIQCPALLISGTKDPKVSVSETTEIFGNLGGPKKLLLLQDAAHEDYLVRYRSVWTKAITEFLRGNGQ